MHQRSLPNTHGESDEEEYREVWECSQDVMGYRTKKCPRAFQQVGKSSMTEEEETKQL